MSPIIGLTDNVTPRLSRLGKIRKGGEKTPNGFGPDLDHFRFTSERPEVSAAFNVAYGEKPAILPVYLPYATPEENFQTWKELWRASGLVHRCDGETMQIWLGSDGKYHRESKPCPYHGKIQTPEEKKKDPPCDEVGRLELILPQLWLAGFVGYVTLETHSINDLISISECLADAYLKRLEADQDLRGLEFNLRRVPEKISVPGWGQSAGSRQRVEKWLVKIEPSARWVSLQLHAQKTQAMQMLSAPDDLPALPAGDEPEVETEPAGQPALPKNGNGQKPAQKPMTVADALNMATRMGSKLETLNDDQLRLIVKESKIPELKAAAQLLLSSAQGEKFGPVWEQYYKLAGDIGSETELLPEDVSVIDLHRAISQLEAQVKA